MSKKQFHNQAVRSTSKRSRSLPVVLQVPEPIPNTPASITRACMN